MNEEIAHMEFKDRRNKIKKCYRKTFKHCLSKIVKNYKNGQCLTSYNIKMTNDKIIGYKMVECCHYVIKKMKKQWIVIYILYEAPNHLYVIHKRDKYSRDIKKNIIQNLIDMNDQRIKLLDTIAS